MTPEQWLYVANSVKLGEPLTILGTRYEPSEELERLRSTVERVEALAEMWEGWATGRSTPRIDAFRDAAEHLRDALEETP